MVEPVPSALPTVVSAVAPVLRKALWKELCTGIQDTEASHEATVKLQILSKLLPPSESKGLHSLMDQLPAALERAGNEERWAVCVCLPQGQFVLGNTVTGMGAVTASSPQRICHFALWQQVIFNIHKKKPS